MLLLGFARIGASAACGDKITVDGTALTIPPVITWDADVNEAIQVAKIKKKPFAIYFTTKENSKVIGESIEAIKEFMKANNNTLPNYLADVPRAVDQVRELGVGNFVKVPMNKANSALAQTYGGEENTFVICTPAGEKMTAFKCTSEMLKNMEPVRKEIAAWQAANSKVVSGK